MPSSVTAEMYPKLAKTVVFQTVDAANGGIGPEIARQAVNTLKSELVSSPEKNTQTITVQINPPELGVMSIQVEVLSDQLSAQIVVSELASAELLAREKDLLMNSLADFGFSDTSVDISHGSLKQDEDPDAETSRTSVLYVSESGDDSEKRMEFLSGATVLVGLDLVA